MQTVLVIEDEQGILNNVAEILTFENYEVLTASNGKEGVRLAQEYLPDLILCDIRMPELDGYGVIRALRADPATASIPVIIMTAKAHPIEQPFIDDMKIVQCLMKPFHALDLIEAVQNHAGGG